MDINRQLIDIVTKEVLKIISESPKGATSENPPVLVFGDPALLPPAVSEKLCICRADAYTCEEDIDKFGKVYITELGTDELADIALGRGVGKTASAALAALLRGKEVWLAENALKYRKFGAAGSRALFQLYEGYVRTLGSFGVRTLCGGKKPNIYSASAAPDPSLPEGVVTEAAARRLIDGCEGDIIRLKKGTVITPSARDVIKEASKTIEIV